MAPNRLEDRVSTVRRFNRFYTQRIGVLDRGLHDSEYSLTEARILFELARLEQATATDLIQELEIDRGYMSRILSSFERSGLLRKKTSKRDGRQRLLSLTRKGQTAFASLNRRSQEEVSDMLSRLSEKGQQRMVESLRAVENLLAPDEPAPSPVHLRPHRPGDIGWVVYRHGILYSREYGFDENFEALVAEILAKFAMAHDDTRERMWIAETDGEPIGSILVVDAGDGVAQLRLLLVEPEARGLGIGRKLVQECIRFAKDAGYEKMVLWTQSHLTAARQLYTRFGFRILEKKPHASWGADLVAETWELSLRDTKPRPV